MQKKRSRRLAMNIIALQIAGRKAQIFLSQENPKKLHYFQAGWQFKKKIFHDRKTWKLKCHVGLYNTGKYKS